MALLGIFRIHFSLFRKTRCIRRQVGGIAHTAQVQRARAVFQIIKEACKQGSRAGRPMILSRHPTKWRTRCLPRRAVLYLASISLTTARRNLFTSTCDSIFYFILRPCMQCNQIFHEVDMQMQRVLALSLELMQHWQGLY